ncbi:MAG: hormogonium polysaccharide biosynthesis glycosyltransferase HpsE [Prochlorotrichaceae cyanobacterium]
MDFTIAIPTYNGAKRLPGLFAALQRQKPVPGIAWEVLVVDNNSQDETAQLLQEWQGKSLGFSIRYCHEPQQGAAFARQRAIRESSGEWVGFLDDDVIPDENWLEAALQFLNDRPRLGAYSGKIRGIYEVPPPEGFDKIKFFLAIRDHGNKPRQFVPEQLQLPPAASLIIRRSAWLESVPLHQKLSGKRPGLFIQGDDYEPLLYLHKAKWEIWYTPDLCVSHHIPASRFDRSYLLTLAKGSGLPIFQLRLVLSNSYLETCILFLRTLFGNGRRLVIHGLKYRNRINQELVPGFLWAFYYGSFLSPFVRFPTER